MYTSYLTNIQEVESMNKIGSFSLRMIETF